MYSVILHKERPGKCPHCRTYIHTYSYNTVTIFISKKISLKYNIENILHKNDALQVDENHIRYENTYIINSPSVFFE